MKENITELCNRELAKRVITPPDDGTAEIEPLPSNQVDVPLIRGFNFLRKYPPAFLRWDKLTDSFLSREPFTVLSNRSTVSASKLFTLSRETLISADSTIINFKGGSTCQYVLVW
jgi:hypothetical protein